MKYYLSIFIFLFVIAPAYSSEQVNTHNLKPDQVNPVLIEVIDFLAGSSTFRINSAKLDMLFNKHCTKKSQEKDEYMVVINYDCDLVATGMKSVRFDSREGGAPNYLMTLSIDFSYENYERIKNLVAKKLGAAQRKSKNNTVWQFKKDNFLNSLGTPVIEVSRDKQYNVGTFGVELEQGETE